MSSTVNKSQEPNTPMEVRSPHEVFTYAIQCQENSKFIFDMSEWYSGEATYSLFDSVTPFSITPENICGTSACMGGDMAWNLEPNSDLDPLTIVLHWARGALTPNDDKHDEMHDSLYLLFTDVQIFGTDDYHTVTREQAIALLKELSCLDSWSSVLEYLTELSFAYYPEKPWRN